MDKGKTKNMDDLENGLKWVSRERETTAPDELLTPW